MAGATRNQLLARLHCIKKERGWSDEEYRDILAARAGVRSAKDLDAPGLARLVAELGAPRTANEWAWIDTEPAGKRPLLKKLVVLAGQQGAGIRRGGQVRYIEGIARQMAGATKPLRMCDETELWQIVAALAKHVERARAAQAEPKKGDATGNPARRRAPGVMRPRTPLTWV